jgi:hypothetical protein
VNQNVSCHFCDFLTKFHSKKSFGDCLPTSPNVKWEKEGSKINQKKCHLLFEGTFWKQLSDLLSNIVVIVLPLPVALRGLRKG